MADVSRTFTLHQEAAHAPHHYDLEDLIPDVFDTTNNALRIRTTAADVACAGTSDALAPRPRRRLTSTGSR